MSIQESNRLEDEFIASIVAEEKAEKMEHKTEFNAEPRMTWMCEHGRHGSESIRDARTFTGMYEGFCAGSYLSMIGDHGLCSCSCHDRRDDITKPDSTYSFPRRTLKWGDSF